MMEMQQSLKSGKRFGLSLDDYSSPKHQDKDKLWNLGIVAISGCMTAEKTVEEVENCMSLFYALVGILLLLL